jgi:hypothetical protein
MDKRIGWLAGKLWGLAGGAGPGSEGRRDPGVSPVSPGGTLSEVSSRTTRDARDRYAVARVLCLVCLPIAGCRMALGGDMGGGSWDSQVYPPAMYGSSVSTPDLTLYWNCARPDPTLLRVDGVAQNTSGNNVRFVRFELEGLDADTHVVSAGQGSLRATMLYLNQFSPFSVQAKAGGTEVRFDLHYDYKVQGRSDSGSGEGGGFLVHDVCSPTQHRIQGAGP